MSSKLDTFTPLTSLKERDKSQAAWEEHPRYPPFLKADGLTSKHLGISVSSHSATCYDQNSKSLRTKHRILSTWGWCECAKHREEFIYTCSCHCLSFSSSSAFFAATKVNARNVCKRTLYDVWHTYIDFQLIKSKVSHVTPTQINTSS